MGELQMQGSTWQKVLAIIKVKKKDTEELEIERRIRVIVSVFLMFISLILTFLNIKNEWWFMAQTTTLLFLGFIFSAILAGVANNMTASSNLLSVMLIFLFSIYIGSGANEGFAALWVLCVPLLSMSLLGMETGLAVSIYFQIYLLGLFYTPLRFCVEGYYTLTFMIRFPILYFCAFGAAAILVFQKQYYLLKIQQKANVDGLTGMNNRHVFMQALKESEEKEELIIAYIDLNKLKLINDTLGHDAGDEMLKGVAECMTAAFPAPMLPARIGGDEFAVIADMPREVWQQYLTGFENRVAVWRGKLVDEFSVAVGCAYRSEYPDASAEELLTLADKEMYRKKANFYQNG